MREWAIFASGCAGRRGGWAGQGGDSRPLAAAARAALGLPAARLARIAGSLPVLPELLAVRRRGRAAAWAVARNASRGVASHALQPFCGGRARPGSAARAVRESVDERLQSAEAVPRHPHLARVPLRLHGLLRAEERAAAAGGAPPFRSRPGAEAGSAPNRRRPPPPPPPPTT